jgi:hypothetical protein
MKNSHPKSTRPQLPTWKRIDTHRGGIDHDHPTKLLQLLLGDPFVPGGDLRQLLVQCLED